MDNWKSKALAIKDSNRLTDNAKVPAKMSLHFSWDTTSFIKIKNAYSESTSKALSSCMFKKFLLCLAFET
jgi:hypothetical protein